MQIRKANDKDVDELVRIRIAYLMEDYSDIRKEQLEALKLQLPAYFTEHVGKDLIVYIAEEGQRIVSCVFLLVIEKPANPSFITGKIGNLLNVYTEPDFRRQGLAGQLVRWAMEEAKELNLSYLELYATQDGYPLYKKLGFTDYSTKCIQMKYQL